MGTLAEARTDLRNRLAETTTRFWSDAELVTWINEGMRVVARRAETIQALSTSIAAVVGTQKYDLPTDCIRVHKVDFVPTGQTQQYPLRPCTEGELIQYAGVNPLMQGAYPALFAAWGMPGGTGNATLKMKVYPVPGQTGTFNLYYYRQPAALVTGTNDATALEVPAGWDDLVVQYAESVALLKDQDPRWRDVRQLFENDLGYLIDVTRQYHDQDRQFIPAGSPSWLTEFDA